MVAETVTQTVSSETGTEQPGGPNNGLESAAEALAAKAEALAAKAEGLAARVESQLSQESEAQSFDIPRPALTLRQAAAILGKSLRSLERSVLGKWGNKLPDGWSARKVKGEEGSEWRIIPPAGFRLRQVTATAVEGGQEDERQYLDEGELPLAGLIRSADRPRLPWRPESQTIDSPTIVIDRSEEVERLLRDLLQAQKSLSEERRLRMEDLRLINQMQGSMRLLEVRENETAKLKEELRAAQQEMQILKQDYLRFLSLPWWKRVFKRQP